MPNQKPNIIYLFSDQHRHDAMGCAGNSVIQTPNLDRLANRGVRFTRAYCQSPVCQPSRASVITGRYTHQHGIARNFNKDLDPGWPTMMKQLQAAGYFTAEIGKTHFYSPPRDRMKQTADGLELDLRECADIIRSFGFDYVLEEFDRYVHAFPTARLITPYTEYLQAKGRLKPYQEQIRSIWRLTPHHWDGVTSVLPQEDDLTSFLADQTIQWLNDYDQDKPFFLNVSFVQPHVPLMDDPVWAKYYEDAPIPLGPRRPAAKPNDVWGGYLEESLSKHSNSELLTDEYVINGARHYYGMVSLIDQRIGDIVRTVEERGFADNTWFVYSADHGEMLGDHNLMAKMNFYKSSVLVPAIIQPPGGREPMVVDDPIESIDLTASILDIAGAESLPGSQARSILPYLNGRGKPKEAIFSAIEDREGNYFIMVATERYRLTIERNSGVYCELFDLREDPDELDNLVNDPAVKGLLDDLKRDYIDPYLSL